MWLFRAEPRSREMGEFLERSSPQFISAGNLFTNFLLGWALPDSISTLECGNPLTKWLTEFSSADTINLLTSLRGYFSLYEVTYLLYEGRCYSKYRWNTIFPVWIKHGTVRGREISDRFIIYRRAIWFPSVSCLLEWIYNKGQTLQIIAWPKLFMEMINRDESFTKRYQRITG